MNEPFDPTKYQGSWRPPELSDYLDSTTIPPMRFDLNGNPIYPEKESLPNPDYVTPEDGTITGGGFEGDREFVFIMRDGKPVRYFREDENAQDILNELKQTDHQMRVNLDYCLKYEKTLDEIAKLLGYAPDASCTGCPENLEDMALRLVKEKLNKNGPAPCETDPPPKG